MPLASAPSDAQELSQHGSSLGTRASGLAQGFLAALGQQRRATQVICPGLFMHRLYAHPAGLGAAAAPCRMQTA